MSSREQPNAWRQRPRITPDPAAGRQVTTAAVGSNDPLTLDGFLLVALRNPKDRMFLLKLDRDLANFINDTSRTRLEFPPMNSYHRLIVHRVAQYFQLAHVVDSSRGVMILFKTEETQLLYELVGEDALAESINATSGTHNSEQVSTEIEAQDSGNNNTALSEPKTLTEKEAEYEKARAEIFDSNHPFDRNDYAGYSSTRPFSAASNTSSRGGRGRGGRRRFQPDRYYMSQPYMPAPYMPAFIDPAAMPQPVPSSSFPQHQPTPENMQHTFPAAGMPFMWAPGPDGTMIPVPFIPDPSAMMPISPSQQHQQKLVTPTNSIGTQEGKTSDSDHATNNTTHSTVGEPDPAQMAAFMPPFPGYPFMPGMPPMTAAAVSMQQQTGTPTDETAPTMMPPMPMYFMDPSMMYPYYYDPQHQPPSASYHHNSNRINYQRSGGHHHRASDASDSARDQSSYRQQNHEQQHHQDTSSLETRMQGMSIRGGRHQHHQSTHQPRHNRGPNQRPELLSDYHIEPYQGSRLERGEEPPQPSHILEMYELSMKSPPAIPNATLKPFPASSAQTPRSGSKGAAKNNNRYLAVFKTSQAAATFLEEHAKQQQNKFKLRVWHPNIDSSMSIPPVSRGKRSSSTTPSSRDESNQHHK